MEPTRADLVLARETNIGDPHCWHAPSSRSWHNKILKHDHRQVQSLHEPANLCQLVPLRKNSGSTDTPMDWAPSFSSNDFPAPAESCAEEEASPCDAMSVEGAIAEEAVERKGRMRASATALEDALP